MLGPGVVAKLQADPGAAEAAAEAFQRLKPVCARLLQLRNEPQALTAALRALHDTLVAVSTAGLRRCFDYVAYPLLFMLDAAVAARAAATKSLPAGGGGGGSGGGVSSSSSSSSSVRPAAGQPPPAVAVPAMQNDAAAEALLQCVLVLVQRCKGLEADQLVPILQHVGVLLTLPREVMAEEVRLTCFAIVQAALQSQHRLPKEQQLLHAHPAGHMLSGFLVNTCLAAAEAEVAAGPTGSKAVRQAAIQTLAVVVKAVGPGPQLALVLPGVASGLAKQLLASVPSSAAGASVTGAAAGSTGTVLVLRTLVSVVQLTLGDAAITHIPCKGGGGAAAQQQQQQGVGHQGPIASSADALDMLQRLSLQASGASSTDAAARTTASSSNGGNAVVVSSQHTQQQQQQGKAKPPQASVGPPPSLTVEQDAAWLATASSKVQTLLAMVLPRLLSHPQPAVRQALAEVAADLLRHCSRALHTSSVALTEILLTLANDDYMEVAQPAISWLQTAGTLAAPAAVTVTEEEEAVSPPVPVQLSDVAARLRKAAAAGAGGAATAGSLPVPPQPASSSVAPHASAAGARQPPLLTPAAAPPALADLLVGLCTQLPDAVRLSEAAGTAACKRSAAALLCAGAQLVASTILARGPVLQQVCAALVDTFQMDPTGAALLLRADASVLGDMPAPTAAAAAAAAATGGEGARSSGNSNSTMSGSSSSSPAAPATTKASGGTNSSSRGIAGSAAAAAGFPLLPRMPLSLQYLISRDSYQAAAGVARALGRAARLADSQQQQQEEAATSAGEANNLQSLVQQLLEMLQAASSPHKPQHLAGSSGSSRYANRAIGPTPAAGEWQCSTAAVVAVLSEVLFGASPAWQPPLALTDTLATQPAASDSGSKGSSTSSASKPAGQQLSRMPESDASFEAVLLEAVTAAVKPRLWSLPTSQPVSAAAAGEAGKQHEVLPAQVLGANALLLRCLIDCVGTTARCAGSTFSSSRLLRTALLPLLERLADPCPLVCTAAAGALDSICRHTGFPLGLSQLVGANADYVVDGVCRQLRSLPQHPRAPQLLAALLREAGVSAALMPLLAEPLRAALSGVSILARQQQPGYILPFLHVLQSVAGGAQQEAQHCRDIFAAQLQASAAEATAVLAAAGGGGDSSADSDDGHSEGLVEVVEEGQTGDTAAARYFKRRMRDSAGEDPGQSAAPTHQQQPRSSVSTAPPAAGVTSEATTALLPSSDSCSSQQDEVPVLPTSKKLRLAPPQMEQLELAWRRAHSAGSLAAAVVDAATPLLLQRNLRCAVLAVAVLSEALKALAAASEAVDLEEMLFDRLVDRGPDAALKPNRPTPAKLLPAVHALWPMLLAALQDTGSVSLLEQQLVLLALLLQLAGGKFMGRRFKQDAWPLLLRLLKAGPQSGAAALAASTAASTVGGSGASAAALLGVGAGPGSDSRDPLALTGGGGGGRGADNSSKATGGSVFGSALSSLQASAGGARSSLNAAATLVSRGEAGGSEDQVGGGGPLAPATLQRVQLAVLGCLCSIAGSSTASPALQAPLVWDMCVLVAPFLADSQALALREAAARLLVAAAQVDADAVWLLLLDLGSCHSTDVCGVESDGGQLPKPQQLLLCPPVGGGSSRADDKGWRKLLTSSQAVSCGRRAAALLPRVAAGPVAWHHKAQQALAVLVEGQQQ